MKKSRRERGHLVVARDLESRLPVAGRGVRFPLSLHLDKKKDGGRSLIGKTSDLALGIAGSNPVASILLCNR